MAKFGASLVCMRSASRTPGAQVPATHTGSLASATLPEHNTYGRSVRGGLEKYEVRHSVIIASRRFAHIGCTALVSHILRVVPQA
jgi:hypothetical protein